MSQEKKGFAAKVAETLQAVAESKPMQEMGKELGRLGEQGKAELAGALFNANAFVPYGAGQEPVKPDKEQEQGKEAEKAKEQEREMEM